MCAHSRARTRAVFSNPSDAAHRPSLTARRLPPSPTSPPHTPHPTKRRRLCILKGIHPREPKKKVKGANKTYYHVKDINWLAHEPLIATLRALKAHDKKVRRAKARANLKLARRLLAAAPTLRLDHLVRER